MTSEEKEYAKARVEILLNYKENNHKGTYDKAVKKHREGGKPYDLYVLELLGIK